MLKYVTNSNIAPTRMDDMISFISINDDNVIIMLWFYAYIVIEMEAYLCCSVNYIEKYIDKPRKQLMFEDNCGGD